MPAVRPPASATARKPAPSSPLLPSLRLVIALRGWLPHESRDDAVAFWAGLGHAGFVPPEQVFAMFLASRDFACTIAPLARLYLACLGRPPDVGGLRYWASRHRAGMRLEAICDAIGASSEFCARHAGDEHEFVERLFVEVLRRGPDDDEAQRYWVSRLERGGTTRPRLLQLFAESPEARRHSDPVVEAAMMYLVFLHRSPDPAGLEHFVHLLRAGRRRFAQRRMLDSAEGRATRATLESPNA